METAIAATPATGNPATPGVLFVTRKWLPATGGMETYCVKLTEELARHEPVEVIALRGKSNGMPPGVAALLAFPFTVLGRSLARAKAPRVLHLGDMAIWPLGLLALLWRDAALVLSAHGTDVAYHRRGGVKGVLYGAYLKLGARLLRNARVIANSQATRAAARETDWRNVEVVPLATDLSGPEPDGTHDGTILFAGRLVERKGCGWFVREVLPLLPSGIRLRIAGTSWNADEAKVLSHPQVEFLGPLDRRALTEAYARSMCVIVPNIEPSNGEFEGFGLVACEAAACGGVVLAARTGGLVEAVRDGRTGVLLSPADASAWAQAITKLGRWSADERKHFTRQAAEQARLHYSWARVARETAANYGAAV